MYVYVNIFIGYQYFCNSILYFEEELNIAWIYNSIGE